MGAQRVRLICGASGCAVASHSDRTFAHSDALSLPPPRVPALDGARPPPSGAEFGLNQIARLVGRPESRRPFFRGAAGRRRFGRGVCLRRALRGLHQLRRSCNLFRGAWLQALSAQ